MPASDIPVSVIIITYNSAGHIATCLESLRDTGAEIIVVDNRSSDETVAVAMEGGARVIANRENRGFAAAANQGARAAAAAARYVLFLNPDAVLEKGFEDLVRTIEAAPGAGAAAGLLVDGDGRPQVGFTVRALPGFAALAFEVLLVNRLWPANPVNRRYRCLRVPLDRTIDVEQPAGACLLVRREALEQIGGWDEVFYPLWFEDVDLCLRLRRAGFRILLCPASRWRHRGAHSLARISFAQKQFFWYRNLFCYVQKNMGSTAAPAMRALTCVGVSIRMFAALFAPGGTRSWSAYWAVMKLALTGPANRTPPKTV